MPSKSDNAEVSKASPKDKIKQVQVLERARRILRTLADCPAPVSLHEISEMTEIHMSTVHRLLWNLCQDGLVDRMNNGRWRLGLTFLEYGSLVRDRLDIREKAIGVMQLLFERTGQTINLAIRRNDSIMYIEHVYAPGTGVRLARRIGAMAPLHCTSGGKLFLSDMPPEEVSAYISRTGLAPRTQHSICTPEKLIMEINRVKELGWADDKEELETGIRCIGAPIRDKTGRIVATVTVASSIEMRHKPDWVRHLLSAVNAVSASLDGLLRTTASDVHKDKTDAGFSAASVSRFQTGVSLAPVFV